MYLRATDSEADSAQSKTAHIFVEAIPVGGYSLPVHVDAKAEPIPYYIALVAMLTAILTRLRPRAQKKGE